MNMIAEHLQTRRAPLQSTSLDKKARTIEAIVATENLIPRMRFGAPFAERLKMAGADLSQFIGGPVLNGHRQNVEDLVGTIEAARVDKGSLIATIRIENSAAGDAIMGKIDDRILRSVSIGYIVQEWSDSTDEKGGTVRTATKWTPLEVSFVAIPADPSAQIRKDQIMTIENPPATPLPAAPGLQTRAAINAEIRSIGSLAGLDAAWSDVQIDREATVEQARAAAFTELQNRSVAAGPIRTQTLHNAATFDNPDFRVRAIGEALFARYHPTHKPSEPARAFFGFTTIDIARDSLQRAGVSIAAMSPQTIITRALHGTGDFPLVLGDMVNRTLRQAYESAPSGLRQLARQTTARDFRLKHRLQLSAAPKLEKVSEHGEFRYGTIGESKEGYAVSTFGKIFGLTRQAIINDDLGAFTDLSRRFGQSARAFENDELVKLLESNPLMSDGVALFDAAHGNTTPTGGAPSETTLNVARLSMRRQTDSKSELISVTPKFVLVPSAQETTTEKLLSTIAAAKTSDANPFSNLTLLVEPRLQSDNAWYVAASPDEIDGMEFAYLEGEPGPQIETRAGFEVDGVETKVRLDFGAGFVEHRSWYRNPGA